MPLLEIAAWNHDSSEEGFVLFFIRTQSFENSDCLERNCRGIVVNVVPSDVGPIKQMN